VESTEQMEQKQGTEVAGHTAEELIRRLQDCYNNQIDQKILTSISVVQGAVFTFSLLVSLQTKLATMLSRAFIHQGVQHSCY